MPQGQEALGQGMGIGSSGVTALPFIEGSKAVQSEVVQTELNDLVTQHKELVKLGAMYGKMDRGGKLIYLDQIEALEQRWGVFLKRFELMVDEFPVGREARRRYAWRRGVRAGGWRLTG